MSAGEVGRYTHRVAISNSRFVAISQEAVTFRTKEAKATTLPPVEFLRRFLQHILPKGFQKIRPVHAALNEAGQIDVAHGQRLARGGTYDANSETGVEAASQLANFERLFVESVTNGPWKSIIRDKVPQKLDSNQVYDWRLAMPWLTQLISWRLFFIMSTVDPDFATNGSYRNDISTLRSVAESTGADDARHSLRDP